MLQVGRCQGCHLPTVRRCPIKLHTVRALGGKTSLPLRRRFARRARLVQDLCQRSCTGRRHSCGGCIVLHIPIGAAARYSTSEVALVAASCTPTCTARARAARMRRDFARLIRRGAITTSPNRSRRIRSPTPSPTRGATSPRPRAPVTVRTVTSTTQRGRLDGLKEDASGLPIVRLYHHPARSSSTSCAQTSSETGCRLAEVFKSFYRHWTARAGGRAM